MGLCKDKKMFQITAKNPPKAHVQSAIKAAGGKSVVGRGMGLDGGGEELT